MIHEIQVKEMLPAQIKRRTIIVASYGGSGSTYIADLIAATDNTLQVAHCHASPTPSTRRLGLCIPNIYTKSVEGPFSHIADYDPDYTKIIFVVREPSLAYASRCGLDHFLNMWGKTMYYEALCVNSDQGFDFNEFCQYWRRCIDQGLDPLRLDKYIDSWTAFLSQGEYEYAVVKYEALHENLNQVIDFVLEWLDGKNHNVSCMNMGELYSNAVSAFMPSKRKATPEQCHITRKAFQRFVLLPDFTWYRRKSNSGHSKVEPNSSCTHGLSNTNQPLRLIFSGFTAGAGDVFSRIINSYNILHSVLNISPEISLVEYSNYHSPGIDYFNLFGLDKCIKIVKRSIIDEARDRKILFSELLAEILADNASSLDRDSTYVVELDEFRDSLFSGFTRRNFIIDNKLESKLSYTRMSSHSLAHKLITIHLRRSDLVQVSTAYEEDSDRVMHTCALLRPVLCIKDAIRFVRDQSFFGYAVEEIKFCFLSDDLSDARDAIMSKPNEPREIDVDPNLEYMLKEIEVLRSRDLTAIGLQEYNSLIYDVIIGKDVDSTLRSYDYLSVSDAIVTASSCFPNIFSQILGKQTYWIDNYATFSPCG